MICSAENRAISIWSNKSYHVQKQGSVQGSVHAYKLSVQMGGSVQVRYKIKSSVQLFYHFLAMISHEINV